MCALCGVECENEILIMFMYWYQNEQHGRGIDQSYRLDQLGPEHGGRGGGGVPMQKESNFRVIIFFGSEHITPGRI